MEIEIYRGEKEDESSNSKSKSRSPHSCCLVEANKVVSAPKELNLPDGWTYEEVPRTNPKYLGKIDKYYYEPGTNTKFRTYQSVLRHLDTKKAHLKAELKANQRRLANKMQFKSVIAAKRSARKLLILNKE